MSSVTLTQLCEVMNNWFDTKSDGTKDRWFGKFTIKDGFIDLSDTDIKPGQYYRIIGSVFNDGVYQYLVPEVEPEPEPEVEPIDDTDDTEETEGTENPQPVTEPETPESEEEEEEDGLIDEEFEGAVWIMYVPRAVLTLLKDIQDWEEKYGPIVASPFNSESFGGYSYYKGYKNTMSTVASSWATKFSERINRFRKTRNLTRS